MATEVQEPTDGDLIHRFAAGDDEALDALVRRHADHLRDYCLHLTGSPEDAEDLCQDSWVRAIKSLGTLENGQTFRAWLFRIAHNLFVDRLRRQRRSPISPLPDDVDQFLASDGEGPLARVEASEERQTVGHALAHLRDNYRRALVLREIEGRSLADIAKELHISASAVPTVLSRARRRLREEYRRRQAGLPVLALANTLRYLLPRLAVPGAGLAWIAPTAVLVTALVGGRALQPAHALSARPGSPVLQASIARISPAIQPGALGPRHPSIQHVESVSRRGHRAVRRQARSHSSPRWKRTSILPQQPSRRGRNGIRQGATRSRTRHAQSADDRTLPPSASSLAAGDQGPSASTEGTRADGRSSPSQPAGRSTATGSRGAAKSVPATAGAGARSGGNGPSGRQTSGQPSAVTAVVATVAPVVTQVTSAASSAVPGAQVTVPSSGNPANALPSGPPVSAPVTVNPPAVPTPRPPSTAPKAPVTVPAPVSPPAVPVVTQTTGGLPILHP